MDVKVKTFSLSCICEGCLSTDRELIEITESHIKEVFYELILNEAVSSFLFNYYLINHVFLAQNPYF